MESQIAQSETTRRQTLLSKKTSSTQRSRKAKPEKNNPRKPFSAKDYKQKKPEFLQKQENSRNSLAGLPIKQDNIYPESSSDEETTPTQKPEETKPKSKPK